MRDHERIEPFMQEITQLWKEHFPDWRFGQLMSNFANETGYDIFHLEEQEFLVGFRAFCIGDKHVQTSITEERERHFQGESNIRRRPLKDYINDSE